jgi:hypothetical protein
MDFLRAVLDVGIEEPVTGKEVSQCDQSGPSESARRGDRDLW